MINKKSRVFVAGHNGMVGASVIRKLKELGYINFITVNKNVVNLLDQSKVNNFFAKNKLDAVIICAAKVGGILANNIYRGEFIYENLQIQNNLINASFKNGISDLIFLGSSCIYPKLCKQPIKEEYLLSGPLELTNEPYAIAKIAGVKLCESYNQQYKTNYKCLMPCNLYGIGDNYDSHSSHFFPALIKKIHNAKNKNVDKIILWGTGKPKRELLYVDDLADACVHFLRKRTKHTLINIGSNNEMMIKDYAKFIMKELDCNVKLVYDKSKPDGTPRKLVDSEIAKNYGWKPKVSLKKGFKITYQDFLSRL